MKHDLIALFSSDRSANKMDSTQCRVYVNIHKFENTE